MTVTDALFAPLFAANPGRPLITHYDDATGTRVELSRATIRNWAAKTANWLRDEHDVAPGDPVAVLLPAHWQTAGVLLGAWWCGATVTDDPAGAAVAVVVPGGTAPGALADGTTNATFAPVGSSVTVAPHHHAPSSTPAVCQCAGSSTATGSPGSTSCSSRSQFAVLAAQFAMVARDSSTLVPAASS